MQHSFALFTYFIRVHFEGSKYQLLNMELKVLELFSGIGGMHYALKESGVPGEVIAAIEINTVANEVYKVRI